MEIRSNDPTRLDANESAFFKREIEFIKAKTYDVKYKELKAFILIPISNEAPSGSSEITWRQYVGIGWAKVIQDYANDFPRIDIYGSEFTTKVRAIGASFGYSVTEIRRSQMVGKRLDQKKAAMTRRSIEQTINQLAFTGDSNYNMFGLLNNPNTTEYTVPNDGTGTTKTWATKTPDQIIRDLTGMINAIMSPTNGKEAPDTLLLPISKYLYIANTKMSSYSDVTILQYFLKNNGFVDLVDWIPELTNAGAGGAIDRMIMYTRDDNHLTLEIPQPFEQFDADKKGMEYLVPCHAETAGVIIYYPLSVAWGDGI